MNRGYCNNCCNRCCRCNQCNCRNNRCNRCNNQSCNCVPIIYTGVSQNGQVLAGIPGPQGIQGEPGPAGGILSFADFYALMPL